MKKCDPRGTDEFAAVVRYLDAPDAHCATRIDRLGLDGDNSFARGAKVIGIDLDADGRNFCQVGSGDDADRSGGLGEIDRNAAVHHPRLLMDLWCDLHFQNDPLARRDEDLDAEKLQQLVFLDGLEQFGVH